MARVRSKPGLEVEALHVKVFELSANGISTKPEHVDTVLDGETLVTKATKHPRNEVPVARATGLRLDLFEVDVERPGLDQGTQTGGRTGELLVLLEPLGNVELLRDADAQLLPVTRAPPPILMKLLRRLERIVVLS